MSQWSSLRISLSSLNEKSTTGSSPILAERIYSSNFRNSYKTAKTANFSSDASGNNVVSSLSLRLTEINVKLRFTEFNKFINLITQGSSLKQSCYYTNRHSWSNWNNWSDCDLMEKKCRRQKGIIDEFFNL